MGRSVHCKERPGSPTVVRKHFWKYCFRLKSSFRFLIVSITHMPLLRNVSERAVSNGTTKYHWALSLAHCHALLFFMAQFLVVIDNWDKPNQNADPP